MIAVAETSAFRRKAESLLTEDEKSDFGMNEKANLSMEERRTLSGFVKELLRYWSL